jgi:hypothetical protein
MHRGVGLPPADRGIDLVGEHAALVEGADRYVEDAVTPRVDDHHLDRGNGARRGEAAGDELGLLQRERAAAGRQAQGRPGHGRLVPAGGLEVKESPERVREPLATRRARRGLQLHGGLVQELRHCPTGGLFRREPSGFIQA